MYLYVFFFSLEMHKCFHTDTRMWEKRVSTANAEAYESLQWCKASDPCQFVTFLTLQPDFEIVSRLRKA